MEKKNSGKVQTQSSVVFELLMKGFCFKNEELAKTLDEELQRTCRLPPFRERAWLLPVEASVKKVPPHHAVDGTDKWEVFNEIKRVFDITLSSKRGAAIYDLEEIRKIEKIGYSLDGAILVHPHPVSMIPTPSINDIITFMATDMGLKKSLNYAVVAAQEKNYLINLFNFRHCTQCPHFISLTNAPLFDIKKQEVK